MSVKFGKRAEEGYLEDVRAKSPRGSFDGIHTKTHANDTHISMNSLNDEPETEHAYGDQSHSYIEIRLNDEEGKPTPTPMSGRHTDASAKRTSHVDFPSTFPAVAQQSVSMNGGERTASWIPQESWMGGNMGSV